MKEENGAEDHNSQLHDQAQPEMGEPKQAEEELRRLKEFSESVVQNMVEGIFVLDAEGYFTFVNPAAAVLLGCEIEDLVSQHWTTVVPPDQRPIVEAADVRRARGESDRYELQLIHKDGTRVPTQVSGSPQLDPDTGQLLGTLGVFTDLTERMRVEEELRKHRDHLEELIQERTTALTEANEELTREIAERKRAEEELRTYQEHLEERVEERTAELRESEERYRTLFDGIPVGLYRSTPAGELVAMNPALVQMLGCATQEELLTMNPAQFYVNPQERVRWQMLMEREGVVRDFEVQVRHPDGTIIWVNDTARAVRDEQGQVLHYEGSLEDITERKQAEEELRTYQEHLKELVEERTAELRDSEERYRTLFDGVPVGLYRTTPEGRVLDANLATAQMFGYPDRDKLIAEVSTADLYVDPEERARWQTLMEQEGIVRDFEEWVRRADGTIIWLNDTARAVKDERGRVLYYEGSLEDITERKQAEEELRYQKEYFEAFFVNSPVAVVSVDSEGNIVGWNPMAEELFGYTQAEAIGRYLDDLVANDPRVREEALRYTELVMTTGLVKATVKRTRKDGSLVDVELLAVPIIVAGEEVGFFAIYVDIGALQEARRQAEAANQAKSTFLANMSHELRTPLNAILGFTQLMDGDLNLNAEQQENLAIINHSGEHLLALINDVLEMSKIEAGRMALQEKGFDLHGLLDGLEEMFRLRAEEKGLTLSFRRAENVPRSILTDEGKLRQVLSNLLGNAVKFTQEGTVSLRVSTPSPTVPLPQGRELLRFEVEDSGPGIAPRELEAVFDPFVQATSGRDLASTQSQEGTGLGLSISRQYAHLMGGDLTVSSELGQGSLFQLDVQVGLADAAEVEMSEPGRRVVGLAPHQRHPGDRPYRLLVAEDTETNRRLLVRLLEPLGFEVREAASGQEAIEVWERWEPDLIWMDMRMPVMDGHEATERIKATPKGQSTVIIALTATAFEEDRERILLEGCDDFVRKPFRKNEIYDMLSKHLGVRFVYEQEPAPPAPAKPTGAAIAPAQALSAEALTGLPASWVDDLQQATTRADLNQILILVDQIREQNAALANALADLAQNYEYKRILTLIKEAGG